MTREMEFESTDVSVYHVQPIGDGLVAQFETTGVANARVYSPDMTVIRDLDLDSGIEDLQTSSDAHIWTSYGDESIMPGLVCWDEHGRVVRQIGRSFLDGRLAACYALNVISDSETWFYYYDSFPLVQMTDGEVAGVWRTGHAGAKAFAISEPYVVFVGAYTDYSSFYLHLLDAQGSSSLMKKVQVVNDRGLPFEWWSRRFTARFDTVSFVAEGWLWQFTVDDVLMA